MIHSAIWATLILYFLIRAELYLREKLKKQDPLNHTQFKELSKRVDELQNQVNSLSIDKEFK